MILSNRISFKSFPARLRSVLSTKIQSKRIPVEFNNKLKYDVNSEQAEMITDLYKTVNFYTTVHEFTHQSPAVRKERISPPLFFCHPAKYTGVRNCRKLQLVFD